MQGVWLLDVVVIKLRLTIRTIAEQAGADALPVAAAHGERIASLFVSATVRAIVELVLIALSIDTDAEVHLCETAPKDDVLLSPYLDEYAVSRKTDAAE